MQPLVLCVLLVMHVPPQLLISLSHVPRALMLKKASR